MIHIKCGVLNCARVEMGEKIYFTMRGTGDQRRLPIKAVLERGLEGWVKF